MMNVDSMHPMVAKRIRQLFAEFIPQTEEQEIALCASAENSYAWEQEFEELDVEQYKRMVAFMECTQYPCYAREDFEFYLIQFGENPVRAHEISECIRKGYAVKQPERLSQYNIPREILKIAENYCYVTSKESATRLWSQYKENLD